MGSNISFTVPGLLPPPREAWISASWSPSIVSPGAGIDTGRQISSTSSNCCSTPPSSPRYEYCSAVCGSRSSSSYSRQGRSRYVKVTSIVPFKSNCYISDQGISSSGCQREQKQLPLLRVAYTSALFMNLGLSLPCRTGRTGDVSRLSRNIPGNSSSFVQLIQSAG